MPELTPELRTLRAKIAAHESWARTENKSARTAKARRALEDKWLTEAGGDPVKAEHLRKAHYARMAFKSAQARRRRAAPAPDRNATVAAKLAELDGGGDHAAR